VQRRLPKHKTNKQSKLSYTFPKQTKKADTLKNKYHSSPIERKQKML
jgi:hypothetical protein